MGTLPEQNPEDSLDNVILDSSSSEAAQVRQLLSATLQNKGPTAQERLLEFAARVPSFFEGRLDRLLNSYELSARYYCSIKDNESENLYESELGYVSWLVERLQNEYAFAMLKTGENALANKFLIVGYEPGQKQTDSHVFGIAVSPRDYAQIFNGETKFDSYVLVLHSYIGKNAELRCRGLIANAPKYARALLEEKNATEPLIFPSIDALAQEP